MVSRERGEEVKGGWNGMLKRRDLVKLPSLSPQVELNMYDR